MTRIGPACAFAAVLFCAAAPAQPEEKSITPAVQAELEKLKLEIAKWASDKAVVAAVQEHNKKGPIAGMTNDEWKKLRRRAPEVVAFQTNAVAKLLQAKVESTKGLVTELFLNGAKGEKVAFLEKTTSYIHAGSAKFDVSFTKGTSWQGKQEFDESSQTYQVQLSVPVVVPPAKEGEKATVVGVLVVGVNLGKLEPAPAPGK
jgi:hypothetical protein